MEQLESFQLGLSQIPRIKRIQASFQSTYRKVQRGFPVFYVFGMVLITRFTTPHFGVREALLAPLAAPAGTLPHVRRGGITYPCSR